MEIRKLLQFTNRPILVRVLTHHGPEYWAKQLTSNCYRHSPEIYYTAKFADLFFSLLLINEARIKKTVDKLHFLFGNSSTASGLLPSYKDIWTDLAHDISKNRIVGKKILELRKKAADAGEFGVVCHDETFKTLFHLIGQTKMSQSQGELHALHTFRGFTGCTIGISPQKSTSQACFVNAVNEIFDNDLASNVFFLFSDAPERIYNAARCVFNQLKAVGEDPMHLIFRLEHCWGGKRLPPSQRVLELHKKFRVAGRSYASFYTSSNTKPDSMKWPTHTTPDVRTTDQWSSFCSIPFEEDGGYQSYVTELATISASYAEWMNKKNSKGVKALKILQNASSRSHYEYLQNSTRLLNRLGKSGLRLAVGTTRNEQLHYEFKTWMRNIRMSHITRLSICIRIFVFTKLVAHSSACYSPTLIQTTQSRLIHLIASEIRRIGLFQTPISNSPSHQINDSAVMHKPHVILNPRVAEKRSKKRILEKIMWSKTKKITRVKHLQNTNIFKRPRMVISRHKRIPMK